ncbi:MAG: hypothetical protein R3A47_00015 [Polyangiales bacterium]
MRALIILSSILLVAGCKSKSAEGTEEAAAAVEAPAAPEAAPAAPATPDAAAGQPDPGAEIAKRMQAMQEAMEAAKAVTGKNDCDSAFEGMKVMVAKMSETIPEANRPLPEKDDFLKVCGEMPKAVQKCMVIKYAMENQDECRKQQTELDEKYKKKLEELMARTEAKAAAADASAAAGEAAKAANEAAEAAKDAAAAE